jgi:hypothetical protein
VMLVCLRHSADALSVDCVPVDCLPGEWVTIGLDRPDSLAEPDTDREFDPGRDYPDLAEEWAREIVRAANHYWPDDSGRVCCHLLRRIEGMAQRAESKEHLKRMLWCRARRLRLQSEIRQTDALRTAESLPEVREWVESVRDRIAERGESLQDRLDARDKILAELRQRSAGA